MHLCALDESIVSIGRVKALLNIIGGKGAISYINYYKIIIMIVEDVKEGSRGSKNTLLQFKMFIIFAWSYKYNNIFRNVENKIAFCIIPGPSPLDIAQGL